MIITTERSLRISEIMPVHSRILDDRGVSLGVVLCTAREYRDGAMTVGVWSRMAVPDGRCGMVGERLPVLERWHCFACDPKHDKGLRLAFETAGENRLRTEVTLTEDYVGVDSIVHGGIIATIFDDVMMWCVLRFRKRFHITVSMEQRLRRPVFAGVPLVAEAAVEEEHSDGRVRLSARLWAQEDPETTLAEGTGLFIETPRHLLDLIPDDQRSRRVLRRTRRAESSRTHPCFS